MYLTLKMLLSANGFQPMHFLVKYQAYGYLQSNPRVTWSRSSQRNVENFRESNKKSLKDVYLTSSRSHAKVQLEKNPWCFIFGNGHVCYCNLSEDFLMAKNFEFDTLFATIHNKHKFTLDLQF